VNIYQKTYGESSKCFRFAALKKQTSKNSILTMMTHSLNIFLLAFIFFVILACKSIHFLSN